jgi:hypothetical protein
LFLVAYNTDNSIVKYSICESDGGKDYKIHFWALEMVETLLSASKIPIKKINFVFVNKANF